MGKGGRCVRLTTYHLHVPIVKKSGGLNLLEPCGPFQACNGSALPLLERVRGQCHAPAVTYPGKDPVPIVQEAGWASGPVWTGAENLAPTGFDPRTVQLVGSHYID